MSSAMGVDPSLIVTGISAVLQATQTWIAYRDSRRAAEVFQLEMRKGTRTPGLANAASQLVTLAPPNIVSALGNRVEKCWSRYADMLNAPDGSFMPQDIDDATQAVKACVCRELKRLLAIRTYAKETLYSAEEFRFAL